MSSLNVYELGEIHRSAIDAARPRGSLAAKPSQLSRYANPAVNTPYPLEYSFHLLGDIQGKTLLSAWSFVSVGLRRGWSSSRLVFVSIEFLSGLASGHKQRQDRHHPKHEVINGPRNRIPARQILNERHPSQPEYKPKLRDQNKYQRYQAHP